MLTRVISGGQTGADQAGLRAARTVGIPTGGWAPRGWMTQAGTQRYLLESIYCLAEHTGGYGERTDQNVKDADATLRFAKNWLSPGERRTLKAINRFRRPRFDVDFPPAQAPETVVRWLMENNVHTLNVAGNSEQTAPGIGAFVEGFLVKVFTDLLGRT